VTAELCAKDLRLLSVTLEFLKDLLGGYAFKTRPGCTERSGTAVPWGSSAAAWRAELNRHGLLAAVDATVFCVETGFANPIQRPFAAPWKL
jgi:hypothetical protein